MVQLNRNNLTNQYLYGQLTTPTNLADDSLIRPKDATTTFEVDVVEFMATGAGRFAIGSQFTLVQRFFAPFLTSPEVPPGRYTKAELGVIAGLGRFSHRMQQYNWEDDIDDYLDRVWAYNSIEFSISDDAVFIVEADGSQRIENFAVFPREDVPENFDLESDDGFTGIANIVAEPYVDPWGLGRKVNIKFINSDLVPRTTYTSQDFADDLIRAVGWEVFTVPNAVAKIAAGHTHRRQRGRLLCLSFRCRHRYRYRLQGQRGQVGLVERTGVQSTANHSRHRSECRKYFDSVK